MLLECCVLLQIYKLQHFTLGITPYVTEICEFNNRAGWNKRAGWQILQNK